MLKTLIVIPTYNESENIEAIVGRAREEVPAADLLTVDDNSPDGTAGIVKRLSDGDAQVHLLERPLKEGLAAAYIAGFDWALGHGYDRIVQMDADFSHDPAYLSQMLAALDTHDLAIGARYVAGGGTSGWGLLRKVISRGGNIYARTILGLPYHDLTGGFNAWTRQALESIDYRTVRSKGYAFMVELKYRASQAGCRIKEIPIHFINRKLGTSKMKGTIVWEAAYRVWQLKLKAVPHARVR